MAFLHHSVVGLCKGIEAYRQGGIRIGSGLTYVSLPSSVDFVGGHSFSECRLPDLVISDLNLFLMIILCYIYYGFVGKAEEVIIPDTVEELCESCFCPRTSLSRVAFSESSSLKRIGKKAFRECGVREIHIPDDVEEPSPRAFGGARIFHLLHLVSRHH